MKKSVQTALMAVALLAGVEGSISVASSLPQLKRQALPLIDVLQDKNSYLLAVIKTPPKIVMHPELDATIEG